MPFSLGSFPGTTPTTFSDFRRSTVLLKPTSRVMPVGIGRNSRVSACWRSCSRSGPACFSSAVAALSVIQPRDASGAGSAGSRGSMRCVVDQEPTTVCQG